MLPLVIGRDANINVPHRRVGVTEGDGWDVSKSSFLDGLHTDNNKPISSFTSTELSNSCMTNKWRLVIYLVVGTRVGEDQETGLAERCLELVSEGTGGVPSCNGMSTSVLSELKDSPLTVRPRRLDNDVLRVLNTDDNPGGKLELLPGLAEVDDVNP